MKILFIGGDARMRYAAAELSHRHTAVFFDSAAAVEPPFDVIMLPLPLTRDGKTVFSSGANAFSFERLFGIIAELADEQTLVLTGGENAALSAFCAEKGFKTVNYFADETLTLKNAALTAEAALCLLSHNGENALLGSDIVVAGSGRIALFLAERLRACGASVTIAARNKEKRALAALNGFNAVPLDALADILPSADFTANTIPAPLFDDALFSKMRAGSVYQELATLPETPQRQFAERYGVRYIFAGGLPGKYYPRTAGEYIAQTAGELILIHRQNVDKIQTLL